MDEEPKMTSVFSLIPMAYIQLHDNDFLKFILISRYYPNSIKTIIVDGRLIWKLFLNQMTSKKWAVCIYAILLGRMGSRVEHKWWMRVCRLANLTSCLIFSEVHVLLLEGIRIVWIESHLLASTHEEQHEQREVGCSHDCINCSFEAGGGWLMSF